MRRLLHYRLILLHYRVVITLPGDYYIIGCNRPLLVYRGNYRKFPQRWTFSTHNAFVYECCDGHCDGRRSCFQQSSTDFVGSCGIVRMESHECFVYRVLFDFWYRELCIQLITDKVFEICVLLLSSCVLAVTSVLIGYVCEVFIESICNIFRFYDFLFTIPVDAWRSCYISWTHFTQMRPQLPWISGVVFGDT